MNRPLRRIAVLFGLLFLLLLGNVNYIQVYRAPELNDRGDNRRVLLDQYATDRGPILVGGEPIVRSRHTDSDLGLLREYLEPELYAHLTGFYSFYYGSANLEQTQNSVLAGTDDRLFVRRVIDLVTNKQPQGGSISLTIDPEAQKAAYEGLGDKQGAVVALEPSTGKILAMAANPTYDPNQISTHDGEKAKKAWEALVNDDTDPMLNRATQRRYPPGSTFKLVTAAAALSTGEYEPDTVIPAPAELDLPLTDRVMRNHNDGLCGDSDEVTLEQALAVSCNTAFGQLGMDLGEDALREQAEKFGFGASYLPEIRGATSVFPAELDEPLTALSAIGQYDVAATPLQMAMVTAAIANGGKLMAPYLVAAEQGPDLRPISVTQPEVLSEAISPGVADDLTEMMRTVVEEGTGTPGQLDGIPVAGKTGTAQTTEDQPPYAWFVAFAPADNPRVAVAVVIEKADVARDDISGGRLAAPIAKDVMEAVINE